MRHTTLITLTLTALAASADAKTKTVETPEVAEVEVLGPRSLIEKNKRAKMDKTTRAIPGMGVRVVGGDQVTDGSKYPFFVEWEDAKCGASLIHDDIALSAAHCESASNPFNTRVFVNGIKTEEGVFRTIERQQSHNLYKVANNNDYDFMVLKLHTSALVDANGDATGATTVALNRDDNMPTAADPLIAVGFGLTQEGGSATSPVLNDAEVEYVSDAACQSQYGTDTYAPDLMFCAGIPGCVGDACKDTCQGDSGGPIMDKDSGVQVGVVSFGIGCARETYNGVYARVSAVTEWMDQMICELSDYPPAGCPTLPSNGGIGSGNGDLTIEIKYDGYARETALSLVHDESGEQLYFQPYSAPTAVNNQIVKLDFPDLPAGDYTLMVGDDGRDGLCCDYGQGYLHLIDNKFGGTGNRDEIAWEAKVFGEFVSIGFTIINSGEVKDVLETTDYLNSWEKSEEPKNYPQNNDQAWPGPKAAAVNSANVNVKFDRYPAEVTWSLELQSGSSWNAINEGNFDGETDGTHNDMLSTQFTDLAAGWYRFTINDRGNDGICCSYRRGWVAITGVLKATRKPGLVYGNNGDFDGGETVFMKVDSNGMFVQITNDEAEI